MSEQIGSFPELALPADTRAKERQELKELAVVEATSWASGVSTAEQISHQIYESGAHSVALCKPGKEAAPGYKRCRYKDGHYGDNPNDMTPRVYCEREVVDYLPTFTDIWLGIELMAKESVLAAELVGCLLMRAGLMLDHEVGEDHEIRWRPPAAVIDKLRELLPEVRSLPVDIWLALLTALALNENVKYTTLAYDIRKGTGGENTLLTCAHFAAAILGRTSIAGFAGQLVVGRGVAPLSRAQGLVYFPALVPLEERLF
jgi:hypothetical protein